MYLYNHFKEWFPSGMQKPIIRLFILLKRNSQIHYLHIGTRNAESKLENMY